MATNRKRSRRAPRGSLPRWAHELIEKGWAPPSGEPEAIAAYEAWKAGEPVVGLPDADSPQGELLISKARVNLRGAYPKPLVF